MVKTKILNYILSSIVGRFVLFSSVGLCLIEGAFYLAEVHSSNRIMVSVRSFLSRESDLADPYLLARSINNLESLGLVRCPVLEQVSPVRQRFLDLSFKGGCKRNFVNVYGHEISTEIAGINGSTWRLTYFSTTDGLFLVLLWVARFSTLLCVYLGLHWFRSKILWERRLVAERVERAEGLSALAAQVSHDIGSPLATLAAVVHSAKGLDEQSRVMLRTAANRIRDIATNILERNRTLPEGKEVARASGSVGVGLSNEVGSVELLSALIGASVSQKRVQMANRVGLKIDFDHSKSYGLFAQIQPTEFGRVLSNLLNNAIESLGECGGEVAVSLNKNSGRAVIEIKDNGKGISREVLSKLGERGETHGKENGNGLGLYHARKSVESWGGSLLIESVLGEGTCVTLSVGLASAPRWFIDEVKIPSDAIDIVVLDDDPSIHEIWTDRFKSHSQTTLHHFYETKVFMDWYRSTLGSSSSTLYLCDYELIGSGLTGLEVIDMIGVNRQAVLVTSHADEKELRHKCEKLGIKILPKALAPFVPIS